MSHDPLEVPPDPVPPNPAGDPGLPAKRPWWSYVVPYPGKVPNLRQNQWRVLGLLSVAELFDHYDMAILGFGLLHIQQSLAIGEAEVGGTMAMVRLGVLPALTITLLADRMGRRRLLLATIIGFTLCILATAFVQTTPQFIAAQFLARMFIYAETMLAVVVLTEELGAGERGWGIGMLGALGALGHGLAAILFGFVEDLPFGWRALYAAGAIPMVFVAWFRADRTDKRVSEVR
jgi:MFS family permease